MSVGDLVVPKESFEMLYPGLVQRDMNNSIEWLDTQVGVIIETESWGTVSFVKILANEKVGWTWEKHVKNVVP